MLTSIYYSEKRDNIILVQPSSMVNILKIISGKQPDRDATLIDREVLAKDMIEKEYELIGFYNE